MSNLIRSWLPKEICPELDKLLKQLDDNAQREDGLSILAGLDQDYWKSPYQIQTGKLRLKGQKTVQLGRFVEYGSNPDDTEQKPVIVMVNDNDYFVEAEIDPAYLERFKHRRGTRFTKTKPGTIFVLRVISLKIIGGCKAAFQDGVTYAEQRYAATGKAFPAHLFPRKRFDDDSTVMYRKPSMLHAIEAYIPPHFEKQADPKKIRLVVHEMDLASEGNGNCTGNPRLLMTHPTIIEKLYHVPVIPEFPPPDKEWEAVWEKIMTRYFLETGWDRFDKMVEDLDEENVDAVRKIFVENYLAKTFAQRMSSNGSLHSFQESLRKDHFPQFLTPKLRLMLMLLQQLTSLPGPNVDNIPELHRFPKISRATQRTESTQAFVTQLNAIDWDSPTLWSTQPNTNSRERKMRDLVSDIQSVYQDDPNISKPKSNWTQLLDIIFKMASRANNLQQLLTEVKNMTGVRRLFFDVVGDRIPLYNAVRSREPSVVQQRPKPDVHASKERQRVSSASSNHSRPEKYSNMRKETSVTPSISHRSSSPKVQSKAKYNKKGVPRASTSPTRSPSPNINRQDHNRTSKNDRTGLYEPADQLKRSSKKTTRVKSEVSDAESDESEPGSEDAEESEVGDEDASEMASHSIENDKQWHNIYETLRSLKYKTKPAIQNLRDTEPLELLVIPEDQLTNLDANSAFYPGFNSDLQKKLMVNQKARQHSDITEDDPNDTIADEKGAVQQPKKKQKRAHVPYDGPSQNVFTLDPSGQKERHERDERDKRPPYDGDAPGEDNDDEDNDNDDDDEDNGKAISQSEWPPTQDEGQESKKGNMDDVHESSDDKAAPEPSMDFLNNSPDDTPQEARFFSSSPAPPTPKKRPLPRKAPIAAVAPAFAYEEDDDDEMEVAEESFVPATMPKSQVNKPPPQQQQEEEDDEGEKDTAEIPATAHQVREDKKGHHHSDDDHESVPETQLEPEVNAPDNLPASSPSTITGEQNLVNDKDDKNDKDVKDAEYYRVEAESVLMEVDDENPQEEDAVEEMVRLPTPPEDIIPHDFIPEHPPQAFTSLASASMENHHNRPPPRDDNQVSDNGNKDTDITEDYVEVHRPVIDPKLKEKRKEHWLGLFGFSKPTSKTEYRERLKIPDNPVVRDLNEMVEEQRRAFFGTANKP